MSDAVAWRPDRETIERARLTAFLRSCGVGSFAELQARSATDVAWFTEELLRFLDLRFDPPYSEVLDLSAGLPWGRWCVGGGLNISVSCLDRHLPEHQDRPAVVWEGEEGARRELRYGELADTVQRCAAGLRARGIGLGDAVGIHLPMVPETVAALLACARIGAVAVPLFSGYGPAAIATRLQDVGARALFTCDAFPRRGQAVPAKQTCDEALAGCPDVHTVVVLDRLGTSVARQPGRDLAWPELLELSPEPAERGAPEATGAEDALIVLYSSGTTGRPKGILHTHCGFPVKSAQDMAFGTDVGAGTRIGWITDIGWMMGPWLIYGATILGATLVLYDGAPDFPGPDRLWQLVERHRIEVLGISPTLVRSLVPHGAEPVRAHDLSSLRIVASTGEPWNPGPWWWLFRTVCRERIPIVNYSGGTEISGGIVMGNPLLPLKPCSFPAACPGIAADVVDDEGRSVRGQVGELVIRQPWIGMARGFWRDPQRYLETYWSRWPDVWVHGDWALVDDDGYWFILGRSDDTLKVAGRRVGPAEVESALVGHGSVTEAAVVGVPDELKGSIMVAFCVPAPGAAAGAELAEALREHVAGEMGKAFRPDRVLFVPALPKTRNGKVMRRVIRAAHIGGDLGDVTALENPAALEPLRGTAPGV